MLGSLPDPHPWLVHLPIALLITGSAFDLTALLVPRVTWVRPAATALLLAGSALLVPAYLAGERAAEAVDVTTVELGTALADHRAWATHTLRYFLAYSALRAGLTLAGRGRGRAAHLLLWGLTLPGLALLLWAGERGGALVYRHGVGVRLAPPATMPDPEASDSSAMDAPSEPPSRERP